MACACHIGTGTRLASHICAGDLARRSRICTGTGCEGINGRKIAPVVRRSPRSAGASRGRARPEIDRRREGGDAIATQRRRRRSHRRCAAAPYGGACAA